MPIIIELLLENQIISMQLFRLLKRLSCYTVASSLKFSGLTKTVSLVSVDTPHKNVATTSTNSTIIFWICVVPWPIKIIEVLIHQIESHW